MKLVARLQDQTVAVFTPWHRVAGVKLHHSLNHSIDLDNTIREKHLAALRQWGYLSSIRRNNLL